MLLSKIMCYYEGELQFCSIFIDVSENLLSTSIYFSMVQVIGALALNFSGEKSF